MFSESVIFNTSNGPYEQLQNVDRSIFEHGDGENSSFPTGNLHFDSLPVGHTVNENALPF